MDLLYTIAGLVILVIGAEVMIRGAVDVALRARITPLVVGLTVVSMGTSLPELLVSLFAALKGSPDLAVGNVVGSNIVNISLILGLSVLIFPIEVDRDARRMHWPVMMLVSIGCVGLLWDDRFDRFEGIIFLLVMVTYVVYMVRRSRRKRLQEGSLPEVSTVPLWRSLLMLILGVAALGVGAERFVEGASGLAASFGVSDQMIGVTIVALGTSLPELITSMMAAFRKQPDISLGNLVGSNIFNVLGILGVTAMVHPINIKHDAFLLDFIAMLFIALLLLPLMRSSRLGRIEGAILLLAYLIYMYLVLARG